MTSPTPPPALLERLRTIIDAQIKWHDDCWEGCLEEARQANAEGEAAEEKRYMSLSGLHNRASERLRSALQAQQEEGR